MEVVPQMVWNYLSVFAFGFSQKVRREIQKQLFLKVHQKRPHSEDTDEIPRETPIRPSLRFITTFLVAPAHFNCLHTIASGNVEEKSIKKHWSSKVVFRCSSINRFDSLCLIHMIVASQQNLCVFADITCPLNVWSKWLSQIMLISNILLIGLDDQPNRADYADRSYWTCCPLVHQAPDFEASFVFCASCSWFSGFFCVLCTYLLIFRLVLCWEETRDIDWADTAVSENTSFLIPPLTKTLRLSNFESKQRHAAASHTKTEHFSVVAWHTQRMFHEKRPLTKEYLKYVSDLASVLHF